MLRKDALIAFAAIGGLEVFSAIIPLPVFIHLIALSTLIVYLGCYFATLPASQKSEKTETMDKQDAMMFPIIGSVVLFSLYLFFKIFPSWLVTFIVKMYFGVIGAYVISNRVHQLANGVLQPEQKKKLEASFVIPLAAINSKVTPVVKNLKQQASPHYAKVKPHLDKACQLYETVKPKAIALFEKVEQFVATLPEKIPALKPYIPASTPKSAISIPSVEIPSVNLPKASSNPDDLFPDQIVMTQFDAVCYGVGALISGLYIVTNWWLLSNLIAICFAIQALEFINIGSFFNGAVLLSGLFFYDIFWVFGTDVMVTVARKFDGPIKLIFPRSGDASPAMLGLGDIVVPGFFIALLLHFDAKLNRPKTSTNIETLKASFQTPGQTPKAHFDKVLDFIGNLTTTSIKHEFFNVGIIAYALGLLLTVLVMVVFGAAQPALLYLVPAVLGASVGLAHYRGKPTFDALIAYETEPETPAAAAAAAVQNAKKAGENASNEIKNKANEAVSSVKDTFSNLTKKADKIIDDAAESLKQAEAEAEAKAEAAKAAAEEEVAKAVSDVEDDVADEVAQATEEATNEAASAIEATADAE